MRRYIIIEGLILALKKPAPIDYNQYIHYVNEWPSLTRFVEIIACMFKS